MHLVWLFLLLAFAAYGEPILLKEDASLTSFTLEYAPEVERIEEIGAHTTWQPLSNKIHVPPKKEHWYRLTLENPTSVAQSRILLCSETNVEYIDLYHQEAGRSIKQASGAAVPIERRSVKSHLMAFRLHVPPHSQVSYHLRIYSLLPSYEEISLLNEDDFRIYEKRALTIYIGYFGVLLTTLVYSLIIALVTKEKILMVNTLYLFFSLLWILLNSGLFIYFFPSYVAWPLSCSISLSYILLIEFAKFFIDLKSISLYLYRGVLLLQWLLLATAVLSVYDMTLGISLLVYTGFIVLISLIVSIFVLLFFPIKRIIKTYLVILLPLLTSLLFYLFASSGMIEPDATYQYLYVFGSLIELNGFALLSLFYILKMKKDKEREKHELDLLRERYTRELEEEISRKTQELSVKNRELEHHIDYQIALMQEIHHRVKNNLQMIISIVSLELLKSQSQEAAEILKSTIVRIRSIASIHELLYGAPDITAISLAQYSRHLIASVESIFGDTDVAIRLSCSDRTIGIRDAINLGLIIVELLSNAIKHNRSMAHLKITIRIRLADSRLSLLVKDNGIGFDIDAADLSKSVGINLIHSIAGAFGESTHGFYRKNGVLFKLTCKLEA